MKPIDDLPDILAEEVLGDMAESFFGARVEIDEKLELFEEYRKALESKGRMVSSAAGFFNFLLLDKRAASEFFAMLKKDPGSLTENKGFSKNELPERMPTALTAKGLFVKLFLLGYEALRKRCAEYVSGEHVDGFSESPEVKVPVSYEMLKHMSELINEKIRMVNERSAICTLQYTRQFDPEKLEKEKITGGCFSDAGCDNLEKNLKFTPIKFDSLEIETYPELPQLEGVKKEVENFAGNLFSRKTSEAKKAIGEIKTMRYTPS